ncbi:helix-turn-helix transcriptional regulator [Anaerostipes sp.]|uniref:helix-turn-helix transcriptional regulator n=1 Tax=Anaerostipes sp. TaxID=1872530 RepID=UPI0025C30E2B|nr:AraC family transcriptional regulator [Anaerostipes sp.]MBS7008819.1 helix-turn-helix transcriptional regulator [Anaerostipes sp.]
MTVTSSKAFREEVLRQLSFQPYTQGNCTLYKNTSAPENGCFLYYSRPGYYELGIADYTVPKDFQIQFDNPEPLIRFGTVYEGRTKFQLKNQQVSSFSPSSFFVAEKNLKGKQAWHKGQHFHGTEITVHSAFLDEVVSKTFPEVLSLKDFKQNHTYRYLPPPVISVIHQFNSLSASGRLTPLFLESKVLECLALLTEEIKKPKDNMFAHQIDYGTVRIGSDRWFRLTAADLHAIQEAHDILTEQAVHPPTIEKLSKMVFLNQQKLKAGFAKQYHMTIGEYTNSLRMAMAAGLLSTTDLSVSDIAKKTGYLYSGNFSKKFKNHFGVSPLEYRRSQ